MKYNQKISFPIIIVTQFCGEMIRQGAPQSTEGCSGGMLQTDAPDGLILGRLGCIPWRPAGAHTADSP